jgi:hypothetical protein
MKVNPGRLEQVEVMLTPFPEKEANHLARALIDDDLTFEGVALFLARIKLTLPSLRPFNWGLRHIHDRHFWPTKARYQSFFTG